MRHRLPALLVSIICVTFAADMASATPEYAPVPAELFKARDGLGNVLAKLAAGREVRVAYFGGSITAAAGWRVKTLVWLKERYPQATISEINAAIGGTGSDLGVFRCEHDVLRHRPDLVFVEFSVNDGGAAPESIWQAFDGIVRQTWAADPLTDICFVYTFRSGYERDLDEGVCPRAASAEEMLADHYGIPSINVAYRIAELRRAGKLTIKPDYVSPGAAAGDPVADPILFSRDGVHPLDAGHQIYTDVIADAVGQMSETKQAIDHAAHLATPFVADHWQAARMAAVTPQMLSSGWTRLDPATGLGGRFGNRLGDIWEAQRPGETLRFRFRGSQAKLYDLLGPDGGQVMITVDGQTRGPVPRFDSYCSYHRLATLQVAGGLDPDQVHEVTVEIHPDQPDRSSVLDRVKHEPGFDPQKYDGTCLRVGAVLLMGELVE